MAKESIDTLAAVAAKAYKDYQAKRRIYEASCRAKDKAGTDLTRAREAWEKAGAAFNAATSEAP